MDADIVISLTHFKGHEATGFGGALKNLGMGCGSRAGKKEHAQRRQAHRDTSQVPRLPARAMQDLCPRRPGFDREPQDAHRHEQVRGLRPLHRRVPVRCHRGLRTTRTPTRCSTASMAEYAKAVVHGRPELPHFSLVMDISPQLRLPRGKRRAHPAGCGHVRLLRPRWRWIRPAWTRV